VADALLDEHGEMAEKISEAGARPVVSKGNY
jgi:hypothetical protein